jgi:putative transferase (TIGR04331 family)
MEHFNKLFVEDDWNEAIYGQLLETCFPDVIKVNKVQDQQGSEQLVERPNTNLLFKVKSIARQLIALLNRLLPDNNNYCFISSYLPLIKDLRLQVRLKQFPRLYRTQQVPIRKPDMKKRQWWLSNNEFSDGSFEVIARQFIPLHIPTSYLEGYEELIKVVDFLPWAKRPKVIFTSNAYLADDIFKVWAAEKVENSTSLVIGQHGGHFGMTPFSFHEEHQIKIATRWLSWGWSDSSRPQIIPVGNLKCFERSVGYNSNGTALMVEMALPRFSYHMSAVPVSRQWLDYFEDQKRFLSALPQELREQILLKLYSNDYGWDQKQRWQDQLPEIRIASGHQGIHKLIEKSRLYISTYNATTYLESLIWNVPTIIFWNVKHWEIKEDVQPYFDLLKEVGIFHETPESAASQMVDVWHDVTFWWESQPVQEARSQFCEQFSRKPEDMMGELEKVFCDLSVDL